MKRRALVIGASGGIGRALFEALGARGCGVEGLSRADGVDLMRPESVDQGLGRMTPGYDAVFVAPVFWRHRGARGARTARRSTAPARKNP